jgi:hypothetical protein
MSDSELNTGRDAVTEALANTMILIRSWINADLERKAGNLSDVEAIESYSLIVAIIGKELLAVFEEYPDLAVNVEKVVAENSLVLQSILAEKLES